MSACLPAILSDVQFHGLLLKFDEDLAGDVRQKRCPDCGGALHAAPYARKPRGASPALLILDPFVRLHRIDENSSGEVAPLLAYLREVQRGYALAVLVVHHAKKSSGHVRAGQALRGSSELHAWKTGPS